MTEAKILQIPPRVKLEISAEHFGVIVAALRKGPYEVVQPIMVDLENQVGAQQPAPPKPPGEPARQPKGSKSNVQPIKSGQQRPNGDGSSTESKAAGGN